MFTKNKIYITVILLSVCAIVADAYAKSGGFSGSRSSSYRSTSFSSYTAPKPKPSVSYSAPTPKPVFNSPSTVKPTNTVKDSSPTPKPVFGSPSAIKSDTTKQTTPVTATTLKNTAVPKATPIAAAPSGFAARASQQNKLATSKATYTAEKAAYKPRPIMPTNNIAPSRPVYNSYATSRVNNYDRRSYYDRRSNYYNNWNRPVYVQQSYSSFGMWDSIALWYMLDHISDSHYRDMYYNQQNDAGMREWRKEADRLAQDNAELKAKLANLDTQVQKQQAAGVKVDPNYLPDTVDSDILLSQDAIAQSLPKMKLCSGRVGNVYANYSNTLVDNVNSIDISNVNTAGSSQNLEKLDHNDCDAAIVQRDVYLTHADQYPDSKFDYERILTPYSEMLNLVCHNSTGIESFSDLKAKHTIDVGEKNSGSQATWNVIVAANPELAKLKVQQFGGSVAATNLQLKRVDCVFTVAGKSSATMANINKLSNGNFQLVNWDTKSLDKLVDPAGQPIYKHETLPSNTFTKLQYDTWFGWFGASTDVITVPADLIVANTWKKQNNKIYDDVVNDINTNSVVAIRTNTL